MSLTYSIAKPNLGVLFMGSPYRGRATPLCRDLIHCLAQAGLGDLEGEVRQHCVERARRNRLGGEPGARDTVQTESARRLSQATPRDEIPAVTRADDPVGLDG